jgi:hypothetical protein
MQSFPAKSADPDWVSWKGAIFGVFVAPNVEEGELAVGDEIDVTERRRSWGWNLMARVLMVLLPFIIVHLMPEVYLLQLAEWMGIDPS